MTVKLLLQINITVSQLASGQQSIQSQYLSQSIDTLGQILLHYK